jgi:hypothetical protein
MAALHQLIAMPAPGDVLSPSSCNQFLGCGFKYCCRKVLHLPDPPTGALTLGKSLHAAIGANFEQKIETQEDLPAAGVAAVYRQAWAESSVETEFRDDENPKELKELGEFLTVKYLDEAAPEIQPAAVEFQVSGRIGGVAVHGYVDLLDVTGRIIDLKSGARKPGDISNDYRFQIATYAQLIPGNPGRARLDTLTKTKKPELVQQEFTVEPSDVEQTQKLYPAVQQAIRAGHFLPNRSSNLCSRKYCSFWRRCEQEFGGRVSG